MSVAKKAVDSTIRRILTYTAEIVMSIILLIVLCIPLAFGIPIWFQTVVFGAARSELVINPLTWFGASGAFWVTLLLTLVSIFIGYLYVYRLTPTASSEDEIEEEDEEEEEESDEPDEEAIEEAVEADSSNDEADSNEPEEEND